MTGPNRDSAAGRRAQAARPAACIPAVTLAARRDRARGPRVEMRAERESRLAVMTASGNPTAQASRRSHARNPSERGCTAGVKRETARLTIGWLSPVISAIPRVE